MAANQALIQGEYAAAPKFVDVQGAFMKGFQPIFEKIQAEQALKKEQEDLAKKDQAADIRTVNQFNLELVKNPSLKAIGQGLRQEALDLIAKKADMDPVEYEAQYGSILNRINDLSQTFDKVTEYKADYQEMQQQIANGDLQISALDDPENAAYASAIYNNEAGFQIDKATGELMVLVEGKKPRPISQLRPRQEVDVNTFNKYTQAIGAFVESQVTKNGSYISGVEDAVTRFVNSNNMPGEKIRAMLVDQFGATQSEVKNLDKPQLMELLIGKTKSAIDNDQNGFAGISTNIEYAQKQAALASQPKPGKDAELVNSIVMNLADWQSKNVFADIKDQAAATGEKFVNQSLVQDLYKYNVQAKPIYETDENDQPITDKIIGYELHNPNLGPAFKQQIFKTDPINSINANIRAAIGGTYKGVQQRVPQYSQTIDMGGFEQYSN